MLHLNVRFLFGLIHFYCCWLVAGKYIVTDYEIVVFQWARKIIMKKRRKK